MRRTGSVGDLVIGVNVRPHANLTHSGPGELTAVANLTIGEALYGGWNRTIDVFGQMWVVGRSAGNRTLPGSTVIVPRKGMPFLDSDMRGDLVVRCELAVPDGRDGFWDGLKSGLGKGG